MEIYIVLPFRTNYHRYSKSHIYMPTQNFFRQRLTLQYYYMGIPGEIIYIGNISFIIGIRKFGTLLRPILFETITDKKFNFHLTRGAPPAPYC